MAWIEPVTDRTLADVEYIKSIINKIRIVGYDNLSSAEKTFFTNRTSKGSWNTGDINRIEDNIDVLVATLATYGYDISITVHGSWSTANVPLLADIDRLKNNIQAIIDGFYDDPNNPTLVVGSRVMDYQVANDIEQVIANLKVLVDGLELSMKPCGTFNCGATIFL